MNANTKKITIFVSIILLILLVYLLGIRLNQRSQIKSNLNKIRVARKATKRNKYYTVQYTKPKNIVKHYTYHAPNINNVEYKNTNEIFKNYKVMFNQCLHIKQFNSHKKQVQRSLGKPLSNKLFSYLKPRISQEFSKPTSISKHMIKCNIMYGRFSSNGTSFETFIKFRTPAGNGGADTGANPNSNSNVYKNHSKYKINNKKHSQVGYILIKGYLYSNGKMSVTNSYNRIDD